MGGVYNVMIVDGNAGNLNEKGKRSGGVCMLFNHISLGNVSWYDIIIYGVSQG